MSDIIHSIFHIKPITVKNFLFIQIREYYCGRLKSRKIKGFCGRNTRYNTFFGIFRKARCWNMFFAVENQVGMYFIRYKKHIIFPAYFFHFNKLFSAPNNAKRVVRAAKQKYGAIFGFFLKIIKVNIPNSILLFEFILNNNSSG